MSAHAEGGRRKQPLTIRLSHWLNVPLLVILGGSGVQIFAAYPALGPRGALYRFYPFQDHAPPAWLGLGGWLAGARHLHFAFAWPLVANGAIYLAYLVASGEWRRRLYAPRRDTANAMKTALHYLRLRREAPPQGLYNGLQRLAYTSALLFGAVAVASGLAIYEPVQLHRLASLFGGYDGARAAHLATLVALGLFTSVHVALVLAHPRSLAEMVTGGDRDE